MKISEIKELTIKELHSRRHDLRQEMFNLRIQQKSGQLDRPHMIHDLRKDVARIETILTIKQKVAATSAA